MKFQLSSSTVCQRCDVAPVNPSQAMPCAPRHTRLGRRPFAGVGRGGAPGGSEPAAAAPPRARAL